MSTPVDSAAGRGPSQGPDADRAPTASAPQGRLQRWLRAASGALPLLRKAPLTLGFLAALWIVAIATGSVAHGPGDSLLKSVGAGTPTLAGGRVWTLLSSGLWCSGLWSYLAVTVLALLLLIPAERRSGSLRTGVLLVVCQVGGVLLGAIGIELGSAAGDLWLDEAVGQLAVGPSVGIVGVGLALSADLTALWRRRLRLLLIVTCLLFTFYAGEVLDILRLGGAATGLLAGLLLPRHRAPRRGWRLASSHAETRVLVALFAATSALGPAVTWITDSQSGPLAIYRNLFIDDAPVPDEIERACTGSAADPGLCRELHADQILSNSPSVLILLVPALILVIIAIGLWRGRRMAWWAALVFELALGAATLRYTLIALQGFRDDPTTEPGVTTALIVYSSLLMLVPLAVIVVLLLTRRHFALRAPRWSALALLGAAALAFVVVGALYIKFGYDLRDQFAPEPSFHQLLVDYPERLLPPTYLALFGTENAAFVPVGGTAKALYVAVGPVFWLVTLAGLFLAFWRANASGRQDSTQRAQALLEQYGGSAISYMTTWPGNTHWISPNGRAAVAYRVVGTIALTLGDPYGAPQARAAAVAEFTAHCDSQGWSPCFYSVTAATREATDGLGWSAVQVAEDTFLPLPELAFTGKKWQDVRTALNKAGKAGITAQWTAFPTASLALQEQIRALSEEWVADKGLPEMGFTLGGLDELDDPRVRCLVALDADGRLHGITSWLPSYQQGEPVGWTLDFMRRSNEGFRGVMEFLIASAALGFKEEGARFMSLSGAPLARIDRGEQAVPLQRLLDVAGQALEPVYGFRSLLAFKAKFQPEYQPLYMAYPDPAQLALIGTAIGKAYLPHTTPAQLLRLSRQFAGRPAAQGVRGAA
ncbi:bifunctional lysylphosphatidylglycerol flippase/synthetase MprF [Streptacidiphilus sp. N1-3]|uniref:Bifunctional lysylphosphatidylglycerol flippase/synthetase MprF n=1 Tax=Streptacidiphilus alkalitolerans TaxID=3342712 RepID=A0ABV6X164_9ACTN